MNTQQRVDMWCAIFLLLGLMAGLGAAFMTSSCRVPAVAEHPVKPQIIRV
jgi:hypothetical protein